MQYLLEFMSALKDNGNFVILTLVLSTLTSVLFITLSVQRSTRRRQLFEHRERLEQKRVDVARSIVPVTKRDDY